MDENMVFCVLFWLSNNTKTDKKNILFVFFLQVMQKQTMGEVGN